MDGLQSMFRQDSVGMLELLHLVVARLQRGESTTESIDQAFRYAHSIRSEAAFLQYGPVVEAARKLEAILRSSRARSTFEAGDVEMLRNAVVGLEHAVARVRDDSDGQVFTGDTTGGGLLEKPLDERSLRLLRESRARGEKLFLVRCRITEDAEMLAPRFYLVVGNLEKATHVVDTVPRLDEELGDADVLEALCTTSAGETQIRRALLVDAVEDIEIQAIDYAELDAGNRIDELTGTFAGASRVSMGIDVREYQQLCLHADELIYQLREIRTADTPRLASLSRQSQVRLALSERLADAVNRTVYHNSYVSVRDLLEPLPAIVRRLARDLGKKVRVQLSCEEVSLFLPAADVIRDAVLHLVRNAVDHGIESAAKRRSGGKTETGLISVSVGADAPYMELCVSDDGRGLPQPQEGASLWDTISRAGFTTAGAGAEVSGEGIGLNMVRYSIERIIGGTVEVESTPGGGTTFRMRLPTGDRPLAVLVVQSNSRYTAIPAAYVQEVITIDQGRVVRETDGALHYPYEGARVPLRSLDEKGVSSRDGALHGLLMQVGANRQMIVVNRVVGRETILRDIATRDTVFSQGVNQTIPLFVPLRYL